MDDETGQYEEKDDGQVTVAEGVFEQGKDSPPSGAAGVGDGNPGDMAQQDVQRRYAAHAVEEPGAGLAGVQQRHVRRGGF